MGTQDNYKPRLLSTTYTYVDRNGRTQTFISTYGSSDPTRPTI